MPRLSRSQKLRRLGQLELDFTSRQEEKDVANATNPYKDMSLEELNRIFDEKMAEPTPLSQQIKQLSTEQLAELYALQMRNNLTIDTNYLIKHFNLGEN